MTWEEWVVRMMDRKFRWTVRYPQKAEENKVREAVFRLELMRGTQRRDAQEASPLWGLRSGAGGRGEASWVECTV